MKLEDYPHLIVSSAPRSGSTALVQFLSLQDRVLVTNEIGLYDNWDNKNKWKNSLKRGTWMNFIANDMIFERKGFDLETFRQATIDGKMSGRDQCEWFLSHDSVDIIGDKVPIGYINQMRMLANKFPNAKFLIVIRDGRDVVASQIRAYHKWPPGNPEHAPHWMKETVEEAQNLWLRINVNTLNNSLAVPSRRFMSFRYEDFFKDPNGLCAQLSEFVGAKIEHKSYFKATRIHKWKEEHPDMMDKLSNEFKNMLIGLGYKED